MSGLLRGTVHAVTGDGQVTVTVPSRDGGDLVRRAFGHLPDAAPGDLVRLDVDERNSLVVVAWQPSS